jgi:hypothetical protein
MPHPTSKQTMVCREQGVSPDPPEPLSKLGISRSFSAQEYPINGLRHPPEKDTNGWYIWSGEELSAAPDFFVPLHAVHIEKYCPDIIKYLALPPGWRFLVAPEYEDVWYDETLFDI